MQLSVISKTRESRIQSGMNIALRAAKVGTFEPNFRIFLVHISYTIYENNADFLLIFNFLNQSFYCDFGADRKIKNN